MTSLKSNCSEVSTSQETAEQQESVAFTDGYDIATNRFKSMIDEYVCSLTITLECSGRPVLLYLAHVTSKKPTE